MGKKRRNAGRLVRLPNAVHTTVFAPTGAGKGVSLVAPFLMSCEESCAVLDIGGGLARITAEHRRRMGHEVLLHDPWKFVTQRPARLNPIDLIEKDSPLAIEDCNSLGNALAIKTGQEKEPHWVESAEAWIAAIIATVVQYGQRDKGTRSLQDVRDILSHPQKLDMAIKLMCESDAWGGMLARMGGQLLHFVDKERGGVLTTTSRFLRFLDTLAIAENTRSSSYDPRKLKGGKLTVYYVVPPEQVAPQMGWLRMGIGTHLRAVVRGGLDESRKVYFVLDEAASLGHLDVVADAVDKYRAYGVRLIFFYQSLGQLAKCWPADGGQTLLSNTSQVFFGVNDIQTGEHVSKRLGPETIVVESEGRNRGDSTNYSPHGSFGGTSFSRGSNTNWQQQARELLKPDEVIALPPRTAVTFTPGTPPVLTTLVRYYEEPELFRQRGWFGQTREALGVFLASAGRLFVAAIAAALMTLALASFY